MARAVLNVRLLSGFVVKGTDGSQAGPWGRPYARRLVQLLILRPDHRIAREELAASLFPDLRADRAANSVSKALTLARHALEGPGGRVLEADRTSIWIAEDIDLRTDLDNAQRLLQSALGLPPGKDRDQALTAALGIKGDLLSDELYSDWAVAPRQRLGQLREQARLELARDRSRAYGSSDQGHVVGAWNDVVAQDPANEEAAAALMNAYIAIGERDRAIRTYHRCRAALRDELAVDPSAEIELLHDKARTLNVRVAPVTSPATTAQPIVAYGREKLVDDLVSRLAVGPDQRGVALLITGVAGIGKTHLLDAIMQRLESRGRMVLRGVAVPDDRRSPYVSLAAALSPLARDINALLEGLPLAASIVGAGLSPTETGSGSRDDDRARLAAEVGELLRRMARPSGLLLALDDGQWMDGELQSLLIRLAGDRPTGCSIVITARSDESDAPVPHLPSSVVRVALRPLDNRPMRSIVRSAVPEVGRRTRLLEAIVGRSQGVPFFAIELARSAIAHDVGTGSAMSSRIPAAITDLLRSRISKRSPSARRILPLIALSGQDASYELLLAAGSKPGLAGTPERCIRALDELVEAGLLHESGRGVRLAHPLLRDATLATITGLRRGSLHSQLADELETIGDDPDEVARHRLSAFDAAGLTVLAPAAAAAGFRAGAQARALFADDAAVGFLKRGLEAYQAIRTADREALRPAAFDAGLTLGLITVDRRDEEEAEAVLTAASKLAVTDDEVARAWIRLGDLTYGRGDLAGTAAVFRRGLAALPATAESSRARLKCRLAFIHYRMDDSTESLKLALEAEPALAALGDPQELSRCLDYEGISYAALGQKDKALEAIDRAVAWAQKGVDRRFIAMITMHRGMVLTQVGRGDDALVELARSAAVFDQAKDTYLRSVCHWQAAEAFDSLGRLEEALSERDQELRLLAGLRNPRHLEANHIHRASLLKRLGRTDQPQPVIKASRRPTTGKSSGRPRR